MTIVKMQNRTETVLNVRANAIVHLQDSWGYSPRVVVGIVTKGGVQMHQINVLVGDVAPENTTFVSVEEMVLRRKT